MKCKFYFGLLVLLVFSLSCTLSGKPTIIDSYINDIGALEVYFCPQEDCEGRLVGFIDSAQISIHCALFEIGLPSVQSKLLEKAELIEVEIITDEQYLKKFNHSFVKPDSWGLMHNKFCIIDGKKVSSGSMNPTINDAHKNNNNLLLVKSPVLAGNYEREFQEMWGGVFKKGEAVLHPKIILNDMPMENYFCPDDHCINQVVEAISQAKQSVYFMTFSFTSREIANALLLAKERGVILKGVMEASQISQYSMYELLKFQGTDVLKDKNKKNMHHKVFIIDNETVVTGSFNPTEGGNKRNDENVLIINDKAVAEKFLDEFSAVYG
ncbi:DUF1669 domain-containing protein [Candidatus Woesearchaeota archaeon]|nr:DUF1669 domain-containing protein [Candidatus Woesearchaeota archaeon]